MCPGAWDLDYQNQAVRDVTPCSSAAAKRIISCCFDGWNSKMLSDSGDYFGSNSFESSVDFEKFEE